MRIIKVSSILNLPKKYFPFVSLEKAKKFFPDIKEVYQYIFPTLVNPDRNKRGSTKRKEWGFYAVEAPKEKLDESSPNSVPA